MEVKGDIISKHVSYTLPKDKYYLLFCQLLLSEKTTANCPKWRLIPDLFLQTEVVQ